jgi:hypothetical protein
MFLSFLGGEALEGVINKYFVDLTLGLIRGRNGRKYAFSKMEWKPSDCEPEEGMRVIFQPDPRRVLNVRLKEASAMKEAK